MEGHGLKASLLKPNSHGRCPTFAVSFVRGFEWANGTNTVGAVGSPDSRRLEEDGIIAANSGQAARNDAWGCYSLNTTSWLNESDPQRSCRALCCPRHDSYHWFSPSVCNRRAKQKELHNPCLPKWLQQEAQIRTRSSTLFSSMQRGGEGRTIAAQGTSFRGPLSGESRVWKGLFMKPGAP